MIASLLNELRILYHDKAGLVLLFLMPLAFVLVITLIQANAMSGKPGSAVKILLVNQDNSQFSAEVEKNLAKDGLLKIVEQKNVTDISHANQLVAKGDYSALLYVPKGSLDKFSRHMKQTLVDVSENNEPAPAIQVIFDPNIQPAVKQLIQLNLQILMQQVALQAYAGATSEVLGVKTAPLPKQQDLIRSRYAKLANNPIKPNAVQQNVPAWAIFGMFFIVVPLSATFLRERQLGVLQRVRTTASRYFAVITGKLSAYMIVNMLQLALMLLMGLTLLPWLGTPTLVLGNHPYLIIIMGFFTALAATSFGVFIGSIAKTYEQASITGSTVVVIAAAIGGIMVPVFFMPEIIQKIGMISPLRWAHNGFIDIFVRGAGFKQIVPELCLLFAFSVIMLGLAQYFNWRSQQ